MISYFHLSAMQQDQFGTLFAEKGRQMTRQLFAHFPRSIQDLKLFYERGLNETEILMNVFIQTDTSFSFFSRVQFNFVLYAVVCGMLIYYLIRPRDYSPRSKEGSHVLNSIYDAIPRNATKRNKLEDLSKVIQRGLKVGNIPPVYPNGWFILLESEDVGKNQVKYVAALAPDFARVRTWKSCEASGCVFVWYHAEGEEPTWEPRCSWEDKVVEGKLWYVGRFQHMIKCHIQEIWENIADFEHFKVIHSSVMFGGCGMGRYCTKVMSKIVYNDSVGVSWEVEDPTNKPHEVTVTMLHHIRFLGRFTILTLSHTIKHTILHYNQLSKTLLQEFATDPLLYTSSYDHAIPFVGYLELEMKTPLGTMYVVNGITPSEPLLLKSVARAHTSLLCLLYARVFMPFACENVEKDLLIWNHKRHVDKPILLKPDEHISNLRRWYAQFYTANSPRYTSQRKSMDW